MRRIVGILLVIISVLVGIGVHLPGVNQLKNYPTGTLIQERRELQMQIDVLKINPTPANQDRKIQLWMERVNYEIELTRRALQLDLVCVVLFLFGVGLISMDFFRKQKVIANKMFRRVRAVEALPAEVYLDEPEYYRRREDSFPSKEAALYWYETDPLRICAYCGSNQVVPARGLQDEVQLVTFYKRVPEGAKDLRIIWGAHWFVKAAPELQCENCGHRIDR